MSGSTVFLEVSGWAGRGMHLEVVEASSIYSFKSRYDRAHKARRVNLQAANWEAGP